MSQTKLGRDSSEPRKKGGRPLGSPKFGGRKLGTQNKFNADVKAMILTALNQAGGAEYLAKRAEDCPTAFLALVGRVLPMQVTGANGQALAVDFRWADSDSENAENTRHLDAQRPHTDALTIDGEIAPTEH